MWTRHRWRQLRASCHACGNNDAKLLRCGRCRVVWFCNRECQIIAARQGHSGANCRPAGAQRPVSLANARSPFAAPSRPSKATDVASLCQRFSDLFTEGRQAFMANTRIGYLAAAENGKEAASVADLIGGAEGADRRTAADQFLANCLVRLGNPAAAARAACSSLRAARAAGNRTFLVESLFTCATWRIRLRTRWPTRRGRAESRRGSVAHRGTGASTSRKRGESACQPHRPPSSGWASHTTKPRSPFAKPRSPPPAAATAPPPTTNVTSPRWRRRCAAASGAVCTI